MRPSSRSEIPDGEILVKYCSPAAFPPGQDDIPRSIFNVYDLSCDWKRFRPDPSTSFHVGEGKNRIIEITVCDEIRNPRNPKRTGQVVAEWKQDIVHDPVDSDEDPVHGANPAHSLIIGRKKAAVTEAIALNSNWYDIVVQ